MAEIPETNILLASFVNNVSECFKLVYIFTSFLQVFETPFYAITNPDPEHEEVLIAIRGTLSVNVSNPSMYIVVVVCISQYHTKPFSHY